MKRLYTVIALSIIVSAVFVWSVIHPEDLFTWFCEALPVIIGAPLIYMLRNKFKLTTLTFTLLSIHAVILLVGAHYTYAKVPLFDLVREWFDFSRNHYDRLGHLAQGFIPAILVREIVIRKKVFSTRAWQFVFVTAFCLAFSAFYELIEWWVAVATGEAAEAFLGTQGDPWDTQMDMFLALCGAILSQLTLGKIHDKQIQDLT